MPLSSFSASTSPDSLPEGLKNYITPWGEERWLGGSLALFVAEPAK